MAMEHKAFAFDSNGFDAGLRPTLEAALQSGDTWNLELWIDANRSALVDPYEGEPLSGDWRELMENGDVQELGDFALTRYYDPKQDSGISGAWLRIYDEVPDDVARALLGATVGPAENLFDPGRIGSYFQSPEQVSRSVVTLRGTDRSELQPMRELLEECLALRLGVYVTF